MAALVGHRFPGGTDRIEHWMEWKPDSPWARPLVFAGSEYALGRWWSAWDTVGLVSREQGSNPHKEDGRHAGESDRRGR